MKSIHSEYFRKIATAEQRLLIAVQRSRSKPLTWLLRMLTHTGTGKAFGGFASVICILHFAGVVFVANQTAFVKAFYAPLLAWLLGKVMKRWVSRERPSATIEGHSPAIPIPTCGSFPSNHTAASVAFASALTIAQHPLAIYACLWAALVSFSRIYLGVHYLSDIAGGSLIGVVSALTMAALI